MLKLDKLLSPFWWWIVGVACVGAAPLLLHRAVDLGQDWAWLGFLASIAIAFMAFSESLRGFNTSESQRLHDLNSIISILAALDEEDAKPVKTRGMFYNYDKAVDQLLARALVSEEARTGRRVALEMHPVVERIVRLHLSNLLDKCEHREGTDLGRLQWAVAKEFMHSSSGYTSDGKRPEVTRWLENYYPARKK